MTTTLPAALQRGRELTVPALRAAVDRLEPQLAHVAAYHLGWVDADGATLGGDGGKALRPAMALLSAEAAGAPAEVGVPGAVAVELVHNFSLLHDDLMDGDTERRHRPTAWTVFGPGLAVLAGDAMLALAQQVLLEAGGGRGLRAARLVADCTQDLITGQARDLSFESRDHVSVAECLAMATGKTGALLACSAAVGAVLADADECVVDALSGYGAKLGLAFQLVDDLLGIWGDPSVTGKPVLSDLRARKKSVPVTVALDSGGKEAEQLRAALASPDAHSEDELRELADLVERVGGRTWTAEEARRQLEAAESCLDPLDLPERVRQELVEIARFVTARES